MNQYVLAFKGQAVKRSTHAVAPSLPLVGASEVDRNEDRINRQRCQGTPCAAVHGAGSEHIPPVEEIYIIINTLDLILLCFMNHILSCIYIIIINK